MQLLEKTLSAPAEDLALDEALLLQAESGQAGEVLRLWERPDYAVILGSGCVLAEEVDEAACAREGVPVLRRSSGGGTVLLGPGCLAFSLVLSFEDHPALAAIRPSYVWILSRLAAALQGLIDAQPAGTSDLSQGGKKFSGNSQQRKRRYLLHHGTLLYDFDLSKVSRYLREPPRQPEYRQGRRHADFLCNLGCSRAELRRRLIEHWQAHEPAPSWPVELTAQLTREKYATAAWTRRR